VPANRVAPKLGRRNLVPPSRLVNFFFLVGSTFLEPPSFPHAPMRRHWILPGVGIVPGFVALLKEKERFVGAFFLAAAATPRDSVP